MIGQHPELCHLFTAWRGEVPDHGWLVSTKVDGWRALWFDGQMHTRMGMPLHAADWFAPMLRLMELAGGERLFLDGEYQVDGSLAATKAHCERGWKQGTGRKGRLFLFDALPAGQWFRGDCQMSTMQRYEWLIQLVEKAQAHPLAWEIDPAHWDRLVILPHAWTRDAGEIQTLAQRIWSDGGEGLVLKDPLAPYQRKRTNLWRKIKQ